MSNSSLVDYRIISPHKNSPRTERITLIAIHCMAGNLSAADCGYLFQQRPASSNYGIDSNGKVGLYVDERDRSWCTSSSWVDNRAVTIEVANIENCEPYRISDKAYARLIDLVEDICRRNGITELKWKADPNLKQNPAQQNMVVHRWFENKSCPGEYLYKAHHKIAEEVNKRLKTNRPTTPSLPDIEELDYDSTYSDNSTGLVQYIDHTKLHPYIATIDRKTNKLDCSKLKDMGVVGVLVEAGYLYDAAHCEQYFRNSKIDSQIAAIKQAELPWGLYTTIKARNVAEAEKEMYQFSFLVRKYPPKFGAWLQLNLVKSKSTNNAIVDTCYQALVRMGLKGKVGFYVTKDQLSKIDWDKYKDDWYLWVIDHVADTSEIAQLMTPEFFDM